MSGATIRHSSWFPKGHHRGQTRRSARHARLDDPDDPVARAHARLWDLPAARDAQSWRVPGQSRVALSVAVPSRAGRQAQSRLAAHREQSAREVLPPNGCREAAARAASRALDPCDGRGHVCPGGRMTLLNRLKSIVLWIARRDRAEQDLHDELQAFIDMAAADKVRAGATPDEARRLGVLQLGGMAQVKEQVRSGRHGGLLDATARDVSYGLRQVRRNPAFSAVAIATLALGIGGITAMFSTVDAVLIRPMPYANADRLVMIWDALAKTDITE